MANLTGSDIDTLLNLNGTPSTSVIETWIDQAINLLNLYGHLDMSNMNGTAGSKTVSLESEERGAVQEICRIIHNDYYKGLEATALQGMTVSSPALMSNPTIKQTIFEMARQLAELDVSRG